MQELAPGVGTTEQCSKARGHGAVDVITLRDLARHYRNNLEVEAFGFALPLT